MHMDNLNYVVYHYEFDFQFLDPDYESKSLIHRILSSDLSESEKIDLLNEIYQIAKNYVKDYVDKRGHKWTYQSDILEELAEEIAWYSLRDKIIERAKRLEREGYIEKAIELYEFAEEAKEAERLKKRLVDFKVEVPSKLTANEKQNLKIVIKALKAVYDLKIEFKAQNVKIYKNGKEADHYTIPAIVKYSIHEESFEIVPLKAGTHTINVNFNFDDQTVTKSITLNVSEVIEEAKEIGLIEEVEPGTPGAVVLPDGRFITSPVDTQVYVGSSTVSNFPSQLLSKYEPIQLLGEGGFAKVFKCRRKKDGIIVAVKIPEESEEAGKSFIEEIASWKKLKHINIVQLYDYNALPYPHIEMEPCDFTLKELTNLTLKEKLKIACRIADALSYAHSKGIVHGDLKPSNVLIKRVGDQIIPKLTDWGMGYTPAYSPPEVAIGGFKPDEQADVWSFGVILYELVTGVNPFQGEDEIETLDRIAELNPDLTPLGILKPIVTKCLERDKRRRYKSMIDVRKDLANLNVSTLSNLFSKSKSKKERIQTSIEIVATYITSNEFEKAEKRIDSLLKHKYITPQAHEVYRTLIEILTAEKLSLSFLDSKFKHILEILPEFRKEFEEDEYIGKLLRKIIAHRKGACEIIRRDDEEFDTIKNIVCMRVLDILGKIACEI